jgi:Flp pilus assembly protein TadG
MPLQCCNGSDSGQYATSGDIGFTLLAPRDPVPAWNLLPQHVGRSMKTDSRRGRTVMRGKSKGQAVVVIALVLPVLIGAIALGADVSVFYFNWLQLQKAADASVLAGANYLPDNPTTAKSTANAYAQTNGAKVAEIISTTVSPDNLTITMNLKRTVPYYFAKVLGMTNGTVSVIASASPQFPPTTVNATQPSQLPPGGDNNGNNGTDCANIGSCGLVPIGLDAVYVHDQQITLQQGQVGPGNWDLLALGGQGGNNLRTDIANGYNGMVSVNDWVTTEPGKKVGPVDQGFQDRLTRAQSVDSTGSYSSHHLDNPRVVILPVVDWEGQNGRKQVLVKAFASVWLDSYNGGQVTVHFISQVIAKSFGDPNAPYFGSRGHPIMTK